MAVIVIQRRPTIVVTIGGTELPDLVSAEGSYGFGKGVSEAKLTVTRLPSWVGARQRVVVSCGATDATTYTRFKGEVYDFPQYSLAPRGVDIDCRGHLIRNDRVLVPEDVDNKDVPGLSLANKTQREQIVAIFNQVGLNGFYDPLNLGGPPHVMGTRVSSKPGNENANVWKRNQSGKSRTEALDKVGLGYRLCEGPLPGSTDFGIYRPQISPRPGTPTITLNEGIDIGRGSTAAHNDALDVYNRVVVTGADFGNGPVKAEETAAHPNPDPLIPFQTGPIYASPLIEQIEAGSPANGLSAREIAIWQIYEQCVIVLKAEISTPRSDLFHLEKSVQVNAFDRFQIQQALWLRQVAWSMKVGQPFQQKLSLRAPVAVGVGGTIVVPQRVASPGTVVVAAPGPFRLGGGYD